MILELRRETFLPECAIGSLYIDGNAFRFCYTLEDIRRQRKIVGETCIPEGTYDVRVSWSQRFQRLMPEVLNVPGFTGIRIHPGNTAADTQGCILVGHGWNGGAFITRSRDAFDDLFPEIQKALQTEAVQLVVRRA